MRLLTRLIYICITLVTFGLIAAFVVVNNFPISIRLWPSDSIITAEIWVFILGAFAAGMLSGGVFIWAGLLGLRARLWSRDRQLAKLTAALEQAQKKPEDTELLSRSDTD